MWFWYNNILNSDIVGFVLDIGGFDVIIWLNELGEVVLISKEWFDEEKRKE